MTGYGNYDDFSEYELKGPNHVISVDGTDYLVQGRVDDPITMFRPITEILECERDEIQKQIAKDVLEE